MCHRHEAWIAAGCQLHVAGALGVNERVWMCCDSPPAAGTLRSVALGWERVLLCSMWVGICATCLPTCQQGCWGWACDAGWGVRRVWSPAQTSEDPSVTVCLHAACALLHCTCHWACCTCLHQLPMCGGYPAHALAPTQLLKCSSGATSGLWFQSRKLSRVAESINPSVAAVVAPWERSTADVPRTAALQRLSATVLQMLQPQLHAA